MCVIAFVQLVGAQAQDKKLKLDQISISVGGARAISFSSDISTFQAIAPNSTILEGYQQDDKESHYSQGYYTPYTYPLNTFSIEGRAGFKINTKKTLKEGQSKLLRFGLGYYTATDLSLAAKTQTNTFYEAIESPLLGAEYYFDSVHVDLYSMNHRFNYKYSKVCDTRRE